MKKIHATVWAAVFVLALRCFGASALAQAAEVTTPLAIDHPSAPLVTEITKMLQGHLDPAVAIRFIQSWSVPFLTSADDLEQLAKAGASPEIREVYARRGAELRLQALQKAFPARTASTNLAGATGQTSTAVYVVPAYRTARLSPGEGWPGGYPFFPADPVTYLPPLFSSAYLDFAPGWYGWGEPWFWPGPYFRWDHGGRRGHHSR